jgi:multicomponent Na+:H+ antiporter subunit B
MSMRARIILFIVSALGVAILFTIAFIHLPGLLDLRSRYLDAINSRSVPERNATDAVTAVNFDYRVFDTLGEEFILFASVMGSLVLLRQADEKNAQSLPDAVTPQRDIPVSDAMRLWILVMVAPKICFGIYIVTHGQLTPGGGFQGGVILASAALIIYLGENFNVFRKIVHHTLVDVCEAFGAGAFAVIGFLALCVGQPFFTNILPLGKRGELTSAGTIPLVSFFTGLEVTAGFVLLLYAFLQATFLNELEK